MKCENCKNNSCNGIDCYYKDEKEAKMNNSEEKLLPCPFCGNPAQRIDNHTIRCSGCPATINHQHPSDTDEWNTRTPAVVVSVGNQFSNLQQRVLKVFKLPIHFDKDGGYFFDVNKQMVGEVRAWGHLQKFDDGEALQDELGEMFCVAFNEKYGAVPVSGSDEKLKKAFFAGIHASEMGIDYENGNTNEGAFNSWRKNNSLV